MGYNDFEDDDFDDVINVKKIRYVYQMRHVINIRGGEYVAKELKTPVERISSLYESYVHGSEDLRQFLKIPDEQFNKLVEEYEKEVLEREQLINDIHIKNELLVEELKKKRKEFAGIGTNKAKRRLNKLSLINPIAKAVRLSLEIEDKNIVAKNTYGKFKQKIYNQKTLLILDLCKLFEEQNWVYGIQKDDNPSTSHIIYFEIPTCEQISWHFTPPTFIKKDYPIYKDKWDEKVNSTIGKLENITIILLKNQS